MRKLLIILSLVLILTACSSLLDNDEKEYTTSEGYRVREYEDGYTTILSAENNIDLVKAPNLRDMTKLFRYKLEKLPKEEKTQFFHDLRSKDLTRLDLSNELDYLLTADFDDHTKWPDSLPKGYDIEIIKEYGMDPGLGIRKLHEEGITGQGIGIAIIDQPLLVNHLEYKDRIKSYEEVHIKSDFAVMHGPAVASIAVGKNVGVAPEADLYYIAEEHGVYMEDGYVWDLYWLAKSIDRIVEINETLASDKKIRVISISLGIDNQELKNGDLVKEAVDRAWDEAIYTITADNSLFGAGRKPLGDPNNLSSYTKGHFWRDSMVGDNVLAPMDSRCVASPTGDDKYVFYYAGGISWAVPYTAGLYALCSQVNPNITPDEFNAAIHETATKLHLDDTSDEYRILNPKGLIDEIKR